MTRLSRTSRGLVYHVLLGVASMVLGSAAILGLCLPLCFLATVEAAQADPGSTKPMAIGQPAPAFTLFDLSGHTRVFNPGQGRPAVLNFWATWCAPCREEMPLLQQAHDTHQRTGLIVLGISQDTADRAAAVRTYWRQAGWTFSSVLDPDVVAAGQYHVLFMPSTIFINAQGMVTAIHRGPIHAPQLQQYLANIVAPLG